MLLVHWRKLSCGKSCWYTVSSVARMSRTSSEVWLAMRQKGANLSKRRRNCRKARIRQVERLFQGNRVPTPCRHQTQPQRMIVREPPLIRHLLEQHQVFQRKIVRIIHNQTFSPVLVEMSHKFGLAGAPMPSDRQAKRRQKLVTQ